MEADLVRLQQQSIAGGMRTMPPEMVNQILSQMDFEEASVFLGRLGALRARMIYEEESIRLFSSG